MDTKRYTTKEGECLFCKNCIEHSNCEAECNAINICIKKLAEYETAEEEGRLVVLPCEVAWYIVNKGTPYAMIMPVSINILRLIEIRNIDIDGIYYSTHEKAEKALKEMEENHE